MNLRKVLITGGTGYLGSRLARTFLAEGIDVGILSRGNGYGYLADIALKCKFYSFDAQGLGQATAESPADILIHTATCYGRNKESHADLIRANFLGPLQMYQASSDRIGTWINVGTGLDASVSPYAMSKNLLVEWLRHHPPADVPWIQLDLQHFYGSGEDPSKFMSYVAMKCLSSDLLDLTDGLQRRDFIHVDDVVEAIRLVADRRIQIKTGSMFEIGSGKALPVRDTVEMLHRYLKSSTRLNFGAVAKRAAEPELCVANVSAMQEIGWSPRIDLEEGLRRFAEETIIRNGRKVAE